MSHIARCTGIDRVSVPILLTVGLNLPKLYSPSFRFVLHFDAAYLFRCRDTTLIAFLFFLTRSDEGGIKV